MPQSKTSTHTVQRYLTKDKSVQFPVVFGNVLQKTVFKPKKNEPLLKKKMFLAQSSWVFFGGKPKPLRWALKIQLWSSVYMHSVLLQRL